MTRQQVQGSSARIARCPEHGLHGERSECFVCGGAVEQIEMVPRSVADQLAAKAETFLREMDALENPRPASSWFALKAVLAEYRAAYPQEETL